MPKKIARSIATAYRDAYGGLSQEVWVLSIALFVNRCGSMVIAFLTLYLTEKLGFSIFEAGTIFSVYGLGSISGSYLGGKLVKRIGAVRIQIIGLTAAVPLFLMVPFFKTWVGVASCVYCLSLFAESVRPANHVAVTQFTEPKLQTRAFGLQRMAVNLGFSVGPAIGGVLAEIDFRWLFVVDGISTGLAGLFLYWFFGFRKYAKRSDTAERQRQAEQNHGDGSPINDASFLFFLFIMLTVSIVFFQFHATYPKYMNDQYCLSKPQIGLLFSVNTVLIVILEMLLVNFVRRFSLLRTIGWGCLLSCIGFGILPAGQAAWFAVFSMVVVSFGEMLMFPLATGFAAQRSLGRDQGSYMGYFAMTFSLASVIAPLIGTAVYEMDRDLFWHASVGIGFFALGGFYWLAARVGPVG